MITKAGRVAVATLIAVAGCDKPDTNHASGTIEFTQTDVAGTVPARIERILVEEGARPIIFYPRNGTCAQPYVKGLVTMVNSIYNGYRMEDVWLDR